MGRRALPKLPANLDLGGHLLAIGPDDGPFDPSTCFAPGRDLEVEVGSGKGLFLLNVSLQHPERDFLGIEIRRAYARHIAGRLARHQVSNARIMPGDAEPFFARQLAEGSLAAVHVYFPDPWWKKRHHKRRIMNEGFLKQVARVLRVDGRLHFWTDVEEYFRLSLELIAQSIPLEGPLVVPEREATHDLDYHTHFERRTRLNGLPVYRAEFRKPA